MFQPCHGTAPDIAGRDLANPLAVMVMGAVSVPLLGLDGNLGLRGWQWLFLIEGLPAALIGVGVLVWLRDSPDKAQWLTDEERTALKAAVDDHPARTDDEIARFFGSHSPSRARRLLSRAA